MVIADSWPTVPSPTRDQLPPVLLRHTALPRGPAWANTASTLGFYGVRYTGNIADMIDIKAEYSRIDGRINFNNEAAFPDDSLSVEGWNLYLDASYYNDMMRVGLAFVMGSGEKHRWNAASIHDVNVNNILWDVNAFKWGNIIGSGNSGVQSPYFGPGSDATLENLTSVKLYFEISPMEKLSINAAVIWAKWTDPVGTGTHGNLNTERPAYGHPTFWYNANFGGPVLSWEASTDLGWELDLGFTYEIMEGLTYTFAGGVLFTGDSWDYVDVNGTREEWGPVWSIQNTLRYTF